MCAEGPHEEKCPVTAAAAAIAYSTVSNAGRWIRASYHDGFPYAIETIFAFFAFCTKKGTLYCTGRDAALLFPTENETHLLFPSDLRYWSHFGQSE